MNASTTIVRPSREPINLSAEQIGLFKTKHLQASGCFEWMCGKNQKGYGLFRINRVKYQAHRISWIIANGPIPDGMCVLHKCDNPGCVRVDHLFLGTLADNNRDKQLKGRQPKGVDHAQSKLGEEQVRAVRRLFANGSPKRQIALNFGISPNSVRKIIARKTWGHLP